MKHWTGAATHEEGVRLMASEPITDPELARQLEELNKSAIEFYWKIINKKPDSYWFR